jgi:hypothetical protein
MKPSGFSRIVALATVMLLFPLEARAGSVGFLIDAGLRTMSNSANTERAIFDSPGFGFGLGATWDLNSRWRFGLDGRRISRDGERAFAADRTSLAFRLGHPLTLTMYEGLATVSRRFGKLWGVTPYLGAGGGFASWKERSDTAGLVDTVNGTSAVIEGRLGFERAHGRIRFGLEGGITFIPNAIGKGGISQVYEESDLGGAFVVARLGFSR